MSKTVILKTGSMFQFTSSDNIQILDELPPLVFTLKAKPMSGDLYLEQSNDFDLPTPLYGNVTDRADRILNTYMDRSGSTGVHMDGVKGSGKTLLAKAIARFGAEKMNLPTIIVNSAFESEGFYDFCQQIEQPAIMLFDEFDKNFNDKAQHQILTVMDGVYSGKKLFLLTTNDRSKVSTFLINRPGRVFYSLSFSDLDESTIIQYCKERLKRPELLDSILNYAKLYRGITFDMLSAAVEEMNRYNETFQQVLGILNIRPEAPAGMFSPGIEGVGDNFLFENADFYTIMDESFKFQLTTSWLSSQLKASAMGLEVNDEYADDLVSDVLEGLDKDKFKKQVNNLTKMLEKSGIYKHIKENLGNYGSVIFTMRDMMAYDRDTETYRFKKNVHGKDLVLLMRRKPEGRSWRSYMAL